MSAPSPGWRQRIIDNAFPPSGGCAFCGDLEARHRIFEVIVDRHLGGEALDELAHDYDVDENVIRAIIAVYGPPPKEPTT